MTYKYFKMKNTAFAGLVIFLFLLNQHHVSATIVDSTQIGFTVKFEKSVLVDPKPLFNKFCKDIGKWWDPDHTWSGQAENLYIQEYIGGCFGERLTSGGYVSHLKVIYIDPGKMIRMEGGLGPLQQFAVNGIMTMEISKDGDKSKVTLTYTVGGYIPGGVSKLAAAVNQVLEMQLKRFTDFAVEKK
jgi:hypothetical protein